jgi:Mg-chelatase subunit ChlD
MKEMMQGNRDQFEIKGDDFEDLEDIEGSMSKNEIEDGLLNSLAQNDTKSKDDGKLIGESFNQGISSFNPDIMFESIVNNYSMAEKIYGETLIRLISGYNSDYIKKNINIPEFKRELKKKISDKVDEMKEDKLLTRDYGIAEKGLQLASLLMYVEELDNIIPKGILGEKVSKKSAHYGDRKDSRNYKRGDRYKDIDIKQSLKLAIRRGHKKVGEEDLKTSIRESKGKAFIIYAIDASGSMKGKKIEMSKKAGIALAYKAIEARDKVGLIVFGSEIKEEIEPTDDFALLLKEITRIKASKQTDFKEMLNRSIELFPSGDFTKHLILISDAMPNIGNDPEEETLKEMSKIKNAGITVSLIAINLDAKSEEFAKRLVEIGEGKLYRIRELDELDKLVLEDYYSI